jgi:DNA-binding transcriptional LysR family regulator
MSHPLASDIDWERHRAFLAVLREGSLSGAARVLGAAQPTVRRRIAELERQFGAVLFTRSPGGLEPTGLARELAESAQAMASAAEAFTRAASAEAAAFTGVVRIAASEVIGVEVLPAILAQLQARHPGLVIELGLSNRNEDLLRREADLAVRMVRPEQDALVARRIGDVRLGLHAHRRVIERHGLPASLADLAAMPLIGFETDTASVRALQKRGLNLRREDFVYRTDSDLGQLAAIRAGVGVGVCQVGVGRRDPELIHLLPEAFVFDLETWVVMHEDLRPMRRVRLVFDHLVETLSRYAALSPESAPA